MSKGFLVGIVFILISACSTQRKICPAYQSAFIFDEVALRKKFSYFENDSTPKVYTASRNRYLLIPEESYRKKIKSMQTIEMKPVYTVLPDSSKGKADGSAYKAPENIDSLLRTQTRDLEAPPSDQPKADSVVAKDSVAADSSYQISKDKEVRYYRYIRDSAKYRIDNIKYQDDQELYMYYLRDVLVLPDVRAALEAEKREKEDSGIIKSVEKPDSLKGFKGFLKGLKGIFKKKPTADSTEVSSPPLQEAVTAPDSTASPKRKKKLKKAKRQDQPAEEKKPVEKKKDPAKKEDDDGF